MTNTFSVVNVNYMKKFYCCFPIYVDELNKLTFDHYKLLVNVCDINERYFYFRVAIFCRSTVFELSSIINGKIFDFI